MNYLNHESDTSLSQMPGIVAGVTMAEKRPETSVSSHAIRTGGNNEVTRFHDQWGLERGIGGDKNGMNR